MAKFINEVGNIYGRLTVLCLSKSKGAGAVWSCLCKCGVKVDVSGCDLRRGNTASCGCGLRKRAGITVLLAKHPLFRCWVSMKGRCLNSNHEDFKNYGGRGIRVCSAWMSFVEFFADMAPSWEPRKSIGRRDNEGNYCPENCRWETFDQQLNNKRTSVRVVTPAGLMTIKEAAVLYKISPRTLQTRHKRDGLSGQKLVDPIKNNPKIVK